MIIYLKGVHNRWIPFIPDQFVLAQPKCHDLQMADYTNPQQGIKHSSTVALIQNTLEAMKDD